MIIVIDVRAELEKLAMLRGRKALSPREQKQSAIVRMAQYRDGAIFASKFSGDSGWERHREGEEIVEAVEGATTQYIISDDGPTSFSLSTGMIAKVPQGTWYRFNSPDGVTLITTTP
jgi:hypothetical protein